MTTDPKRELARELYLQGKKYQEIADEVGVSLSAVKSWATRYWRSEKLQPKKQKVATEVAEKVATKRHRGGQPGNHNATGPPGNQNARKHGLFARYVQPDIKEIMEGVKEMNRMDMLMEAIEFWFAKIIKAQQVMYVENRDAMTKEIAVEGAESTAYDIQYAWDKQAAEIKALSRAFSEFRGLLKLYDELSKSEQATDEQNARIELLKAQVKKMNGEDKDSGILVTFKRASDKGAEN